MRDRHVNWPPPTEALIFLAEELGRISARIAFELGIDLDIDDPEVARTVMLTTFDGLFLSMPRNRGGSHKTAECEDG